MRVGLEAMRLSCARLVPGSELAAGHGLGDAVRVRRVEVSVVPGFVVLAAVVDQGSQELSFGGRWGSASESSDRDVAF